MSRVDLHTERVAQCRHTSILTFCRHFGISMAVPFLLCAFAASGQTGQSSSATIIVDANQVVGHQNPNLYGAFMEMMAWDVKYGLYAETVSYTHLLPV